MEGIKVVELGVWVAGPAAGGILADWGADVVKVEAFAGDPARAFGKMLGGDLDDNPVFELDNRSKRSIVLDRTVLHFCLHFLASFHVPSFRSIDIVEHRIYLCSVISTA